MAARRLIPLPPMQVVSGPRPIRDGSAYDRYFPRAEERDRIIIRDGEVEDTVQLMQKVVHKYLGDTAEIAKVLKGA